MKYWAITIGTAGPASLQTVREHLDALWEGDDEILSRVVEGVRDHGAGENTWTVAIATRDDDLEILQERMFALAFVFDPTLRHRVESIHQHGVTDTPPDTIG